MEVAFTGNKLGQFVPLSMIVYSYLTVSNIPIVVTISPENTMKLLRLIQQKQKEIEMIEGVGGREKEEMKMTSKKVRCMCVHTPEPLSLKCLLLGSVL